MGGVLGLSVETASTDGGNTTDGAKRFLCVGFFRMLYLGEGKTDGEADGAELPDNTAAPEKDTEGRRGEE